jgi:hypothetical protein
MHQNADGSWRIDRLNEALAVNVIMHGDTV